MSDPHPQHLVGGSLYRHAPQLPRPDGRAILLPSRERDGLLGRIRLLNHESVRGGQRVIPVGGLFTGLGSLGIDEAASKQAFCDAVVTTFLQRFPNVTNPYKVYQLNQVDLNACEMNLLTPDGAIPHRFTGPFQWIVGEVMGDIDLWLVRRSDD